MTPELLPLFVGVPLLAAGVTAFAGDRRRWPLVLLFAVLAAQLTAAGSLVAATRDGEVLAHGVGAWVPGIAIPFAGDMLAALMLLFTGFLTLMCSWYAVASGIGRVRLFAPLVLALTAGVNGALLTADIFNLFVFIEVMLLPSYGLLVLAGRGRGTLRSVTGSRLYVTFNLFVSTLFLAGVGLIYGTAGTVNLGELAGVAAEDGRVAVGAGVALAALMMKAATIPTHGWLARAYPSTSPAVTALFSGLHTKVAIYAIYRLYAVLFDGDQRWLPIGLTIFALTMAIGVLGAVGEHTTRSILAFHMVSQIGYILVGVGLFTAAGLAAGLFYLLHHMVVKASLFLSTGAVEDTYGTNRIGELSGIGRREPVVAAAFAIAALSLAGLPPFSGFVAKLTLIIASIDAGQIAVVVIAIVVSLVTLQSMLKIWNNVFVSPLPEGEGRERRIGWWLAAPAVLTAAVTVVLGLGAQGLLGLTEVAAGGLLDTSTYVAEVLR
ncbi:monovalent cation/H+ antiporter subunit D family protein [Aeromicrobium sp. YIM 150415]|uniref:monovalent cation/H+ antiporter subunit D family protein n=1 Tax=Aeromicrobium sp. YIM 150415 TaxID=2803912 RepID=UPI001962C01B|nr:monovalent cation/H+ antiporter subunit D family protein [Aeromicrobium sp. YIM 150415]MBM9464722.1 monovalent cation/H+ antiporter subunit D family protein [Aeromicrobium sp. YIM 150415]